MLAPGPCHHPVGLHREVPDLGALLGLLPHVQASGLTPQPQKGLWSRVCRLSPFSRQANRVPVITGLGAGSSIYAPSIPS